MGEPQAIDEDVVWPEAEANELRTAATSLADLLEGQIESRAGAATDAQVEFRGLKADEFDSRLITNASNADTLITNLRAISTAIGQAEQWAIDEQAAREQARDEENDRDFGGLRGVAEDFLGL